MAYFGLKLDQDLKNRAAHPQQEFRRVPHPRTELPLSNISFDTHARVKEIKSTNYLREQQCNFVPNSYKKIRKLLFLVIINAVE